MWLALTLGDLTDEKLLKAFQKLEPWLSVTGSFLPSSNKPKASLTSLSRFSLLLKERVGSQWSPGSCLHLRHCDPNIFLGLLWTVRRMKLESFHEVTLKTIKCYVNKNIILY